MTEPVAGFVISNVCPSAASTLSPPMNIRAVVGAAVLGLGARSSVVIRGFLMEVRDAVGRDRSVTAIIRRTAAGPAERRPDQRPYASLRSPVTMPISSGPE